MEHVSHPLALPGVLVAVPLAFHAVRLGCGMSLKAAEEAGWVLPPTVGGGGGGGGRQGKGEGGKEGFDGVVRG